VLSNHGPQVYFLSLPTAPASFSARGRATRNLSTQDGRTRQIIRRTSAPQVALKPAEELS
ncbi:MAG TPA: hypothetical protein VGR96_16000, partial [Acidobacteriaceae bacterium]|nr:hypothetical protein [Acidobacteriaceae bacterium]